jgi:hypothetical protein
VRNLKVAIKLLCKYFGDRANKILRRIFGNREIKIYILLRMLAVFTFKATMLE